MTKWFPVFLLLIASILGGCCMHSQVVPPPEKANFVDVLKDQTVALVQRDSDGDIAAFCTGVWVSRTEILTADHCIKSPVASKLGIDLDDDDEEGTGLALVEAMEKGFEVQFILAKDSTGIYREPKAMYKAKVTKFDRDHDLALLVTNDVAVHPYAQLAGTSPRLGDVIHAMGHPAGLTWTYVRGHVGAYREDNFYPMRHKKGPWLQMSAPIWKGNSGGGAFNEAGELVGIASFISPAPSQGFFVHVDSIRVFLSPRS